MSTETPPQPGLTRRDTDHPHPLYPGSYIDDAEMREIERRADRRATTHDTGEPILLRPLRPVSRQAKGGRT